MHIKQVLIIRHAAKPEALTLAQSIQEYLRAKNIEAHIREITDFDSSARQYDLIITLGGDGTVLSAARIFAPTPILPINMGHLGFITEFSEQEWEQAVERVLHSDTSTVERSMLSYTLLQRQAAVQSGLALNDVVISGSGTSRLINLLVHIDNSEEIVYRADGIIVSTATGSTAYSAAAGGPILHPAVNAIILNPICPFTLSHRPLVLPSWVGLRVEILSEQRTDIVLTVDGQATYSLNPEDQISLGISDEPVHIVHARGRNFYEVLRNKLNWAGGSSLGIGHA